jgi:NTP pyrophosphatase (non-canonical NTP hydrolase)
MNTDLTFRQAIDLYRPIYKRFERIEGRRWGVEGAMIELTKQVGELAKLVMVAEGYYFPGRAQMPEYAASNERIADELADVFAQLIRIADYYGIDFQEAHIHARQAEAEYLEKSGGA